MEKKHILVVDDEEDILELVQFNLEREGYRITTSASGEDAIQMALDKHPDLVVLDLMLPGLDGLEVAKFLKGDAKTRDIPIVMLSAKGEESDVVIGLELGADDYVTKPFSTKILSARIKAVLRRRTQGEEAHSDTIKIHNLIINAGRREVLVDGESVDLTYTEFGVLHFLVKRPGWVYTRNQIVDAVKGGDYFVTDRTVDVQMVGLRRKLGSAGKYIETVRGVGYRFKE